MVRLGFKNFLATTLFRSSKAAKVDLSNVDMDNVLFPNAAAPSALAASVASGDLPGPTRQPGQGIIHSSVAGLQTEGKRLRPTNLNTTAASKAAPGCPGGPRLSRGPPGLPGCQLGPSKAPQKTRPKFVRIICQDTARPKFVRSVSNICQPQMASKTASKAASGHPGGTKVNSWPHRMSWPSFKAKIQDLFLHIREKKAPAEKNSQPQATSKTASKTASGCSEGTKVEPWPPWTSGPSIKTTQGPKNSRPKFFRSLQVKYVKSKISCQKFVKLERPRKRPRKRPHGAPGGPRLGPGPLGGPGRQLEPSEAQKTPKFQSLTDHYKGYVCNSLVSNIFQTQTISKAAPGAASGCPGGTRVRPWLPGTSWPSAKAIRGRGPKNPRPKSVRSPHVLRKNPVSNTCQPQTASKVAPGCPWGTKVRPWPPWTSGPSIGVVKGPKHSRPKSVRCHRLAICHLHRIIVIESS